MAVFNLYRMASHRIAAGRTGSAAAWYLRSRMYAGYAVWSSYSQFLS